MRINFAIAIVCRAITIAKYRTDVENKAKRLRAITLHGKIKKKYYIVVEIMKISIFWVHQYYFRRRNFFKILTLLPLNGI